MHDDLAISTQRNFGGIFLISSHIGIHTGILLFALDETVGHHRGSRVCQSKLRCPYPQVWMAQFISRLIFKASPASFIVQVGVTNQNIPTSRPASARIHFYSSCLIYTSTPSWSDKVKWHHPSCQIVRTRKQVPYWLAMTVSCIKYRERWRISCRWCRVV